MTESVVFIERIADRVLKNDINNAWAVDSGLSYSGTPRTVFAGGEHLAGKTVTGLADGVVIPPFIMPLSGMFTLATPASNVNVGIGYNCDLKTLPLDVGEPSVQGKVKKVPEVNTRVFETLNLQIGVDFDHLVTMKDVTLGQVSSTLTGQQSQIVNGLVSGDSMTILSPAYTVPGQYCIRQNKPLPATILGLYPVVVQGDQS